jgi:hypothetical protein
VLFSIHLSEDNPAVVLGIFLTKFFPLRGKLFAVVAPSSIVLDEQFREFGSGSSIIFISEDNYTVLFLVSAS